MHNIYRWLFRFASAILLLGIIGLIVIMAMTQEAMDDMDAILEREYVYEENNVIVFDQETYKGNIVIYPGGLVEAHAYAMLANLLHEEGYRVFIVRMPLNLAILNRSAFNDIVDTFPSEYPWYGVGHSLGGASLAYVDFDKLDGLVLLGSYFPSGVDISNEDLPVLSITAEFDEVINWEHYDERKDLLPADTIFQMILGGNHAQFGYYGTQRGDGQARITRAEQHVLVVLSIIEFIE